MNGSALRKANRVCTAILLTAACATTTIAVIEAFLVLVLFGNCPAW